MTFSQRPPRAADPGVAHTPALLSGPASSNSVLATTWEARP
ncbi:MAG TPA: hypothetical protein VGN28_03850 [Blastococcus sp.]|nr:hypothetical protein [Blastococcus sp.]